MTDFAGNLRNTTKSAQAAAVVREADRKVHDAETLVDFSKTLAKMVINKLEASLNKAAEDGHSSLSDIMR